MKRRRPSSNGKERKLSVSISPAYLYNFGKQRIIELRYATKQELNGRGSKKAGNKGWSKYVQFLIEQDMKQHESAQSASVIAPPHQN